MSYFIGEIILYLLFYCLSRLVLCVTFSFDCFICLIYSALTEFMLFDKECTLSAKLADFMGSPTGSRTSIIKQLWVYIKANDLQNPSDRREILNDDKFQDLFGCERMSMFQMNKLLNEHIEKS